MAASSYWYVEEYRPDIDAVLEALREREFKAGRYNPVVTFPQFPVGPDSSSPGAQHSSIREALMASSHDGTRSILDICRVSDEPEFGSVSRLPDEAVKSLYGTTRPTRDMVEADMGFFEDMERGHGIYMILYKDDKPNEILFAGYSFD
jgi:hypothetical protein